MCVIEESRMSTLNMQKIEKTYLNPSLAEHDMPYISKQCRSRSVGFWTESELFVIKYVNFYQKSGSSYLIAWKLEVGVAS